jgi:hypothetical protein
MLLAKARFIPHQPDINFQRHRGDLYHAEAPFIAIRKLPVYTGSIMVLFLFVIMLLGVEKTGPSTVLVWQRPADTYWVLYYWPKQPM